MSESKSESGTKKAAAKKPTAKKTEAAPADGAEAKKAPAKAAASEKKAKKAAEPVKKTGKLVADSRLYDVIERPVITEKSTIAAEQNKVVFRISPTASKQDVKSAVEALFGVNVEKVNTINTKGKVKRFRGRVGQRSDQRKAIVTLKAGQSIDLAAGIK
jgi:large subunit ribosomal protein L23